MSSYCSDICSKQNTDKCRDSCTKRRDEAACPQSTAITDKTFKSSRFKGCVSDCESYADVDADCSNRCKLDFSEPCFSSEEDFINNCTNSCSLDLSYPLCLQRCAERHIPYCGVSLLFEIKQRGLDADNMTADECQTICETIPSQSESGDYHFGKGQSSLGNNEGRSSETKAKCGSVCKETRKVDNLNYIQMYRASVGAASLIPLRICEMMFREEDSPKDALSKEDSTANSP